jgi:Ca2+-binding EF-hand superfamily protein
VFEFCDGDASGLISSQETCMAMAHFLNRPVSFEEKFRIQGFFDNCEGRQMSFEKFKGVLVPWLLSTGVVIKAPPQPLNKQIFKFVDADGSGKVSGDEALLGLKFLGKKMTPEDKAAILGLPCFADGGEVDFAQFENSVLPVLMTTDTSTAKKKEMSVVERGEKILSGGSLSAEEKVKAMAALHDDAKKSDWLKGCGGFDLVDKDAEIVTNFEQSGE